MPQRAALRIGRTGLRGGARVVRVSHLRADSGVAATQTPAPTRPNRAVCAHG